MLADSWLFSEGFAGGALPVEGARLYNLAVQPVPLPSGLLKLAALPAFGLGCLGFHVLQRRLQIAWGVPGNRGDAVTLDRSMTGGLQVFINFLCIVGFSAYAICAYLLHHRILKKVLNPLFNPRSWMAHSAMTAVMFAVALASSIFLRENWVAAACGLFLYFSYSTCGRTVQQTASQRGQVGLGPSRDRQDVGCSFHEDGGSLEAGRDAKSAPLVHATLLGGDPGAGLRFATVHAEPFTLGDDAVLVELKHDGAYAYCAPCGRANIFRVDFIVMFLLTFVLHLPEFVIGAGGFNQCVGVVELISSLVYVPVGYTCYAVVGFRVGLATKWSMAVVFVLCLWPLIFLILGGKGCATLVELVVGRYLPQIWDPSARTFEFNRGYATCTEAAHRVGGETLIVASTTMAAWVHIMSNFSFLFGFISGLPRMRCGRDPTQEIVIS